MSGVEQINSNKLASRVDFSASPTHPVYLSCQTNPSPLTTSMDFACVSMKCYEHGKFTTAAQVHWGFSFSLYESYAHGLDVLTDSLGLAGVRKRSNVEAKALAHGPQTLKH